MESVSVPSRKVPVRSKVSDKDLAEKIRRERLEHPSEFAPVSSAEAVGDVKNYFISSVAQVIAKWL